MIFPMGSLTNLPGVFLFLSLLRIPFPPYLISLGILGVSVLVVEYATFMSNADFALAFGPRLLQRSSANTAKDFETTYDFIVVGGGSGGAVVAARLSQTYSVLLIEAGGDPHPLTYLPVAVGPLLNQPLIDWQYKTEPQEASAFANPGKRVLWPRGKSLGGCSNTNFMIYARGNPNDFNRWANLTQDPLWSFESVEKYFRKLEDYHGHLDKRNYGVGGPMHIEKVGFNTKSSEYWFQAGREVRGFGGGTTTNQTEGLFQLDVTQKWGLRFSTFRGYIWPNKGNSKLTIHRYSHATKIMFDDELRAVGVTYFRHGFEMFARANKEIILSAGAINTPKLLLLSGIGPKEHLSSVGIQTLVDLQVGENLQDHVTTLAGPYILDQPISLNPSRDVNLGSIAKFLLTSKGVPTSPDTIEAVGQFASSRGSKDWPDALLSLLGLGIYKTYAQDLSRAYGLDPEVITQYLKGHELKDANVVGISLGLPESRGFIRLRDSDPNSDPIIDPRYYTDDQGADITVMVDALEFVTKLYENTTTFQQLGAQLPKNHLPGCEYHPLRSRDYWECFARSLTSTLFHPCCTCPMGRATDPKAVLDSELRVIGTKGLRVADASIMPLITNANLNAPTIMIGEVAADLILNHWTFNEDIR